MPYEYGFRRAIVSTAIVASVATSAGATPSRENDIRQLVKDVLAKDVRVGSAPKLIPALKSMANQSLPDFQQTDMLSREFSRLAREWKDGRNPTMMTSRMVSHPAYRSIIRMGLAALPMILQELRREPDEWFYALAKITGENPIPDACRGRFPQMVESWLKWGKTNGYLV
ncbi:MAG: hypothetical protein M3O30_17090 [Planctomycetota bacterium]|nr:hypothetical protein [Planctomycetota bacterium]